MTQQICSQGLSLSHPANRRKDLGASAVDVSGRCEPDDADLGSGLRGSCLGLRAAVGAHLPKHARPTEFA